MVGGQLDDAVETLEKTLESKPNESQAGILLTLAKLRQGDFDGAIQAANQLRTKEPANPLYVLALPQGPSDDHGDVRIRHVQAFVEHP